MRKTLLSSLLLVLVSVMSYAAVVNDSIYVLKVDFESGVIPEGWTQEYVASDIYGEHPWVIEKSAESDYPKAVKANGEYILALRNNSKSTIGYTTRLISPVMDLSLNKVFQPILVFNHAQQQRTGDFDQLKVFYRSKADDQWIRLDGRNGNPEFDKKIAQWQMDTILLTSQSETYQIMFEVTDRFGRGVVLDDIQVRPMPTCLDPYGFEVSTLTTSAATISWNASFDTDSFEVALTTVALNDTVEIDPATVVWNGFLTDDEFSFSTAAKDITLLRDKAYYIYVRAYCQGAISEWGATSFRTKNIVNLPLTETFTKGEGWEYKSGSINHISYWTHGTSIKQDDGVTMEFMPFVNTNTEPGTTSAGYYAYDQNFCLAFTGARSVSTSIPAGEYVYAATPELNVASLKSVQVSFWGTAYQSVGDDFASGIIVGVMTDPEDFSTFVAIDTCYITEPKAFNKFGVSLANYQGEGKYVAFASDFKNKKNCFYIDEIEIKETAAPIWPGNIYATKQTPRSFELSLDSHGFDYNVIVTKHVIDSKTGHVLVEPSTKETDILVSLTNQKEQKQTITLPEGSDGQFIEVYVQAVANGAAGDWALPVKVLIPRHVSNAQLPLVIDFEGDNVWTPSMLNEFSSTYGNTTKYPMDVEVAPATYVEAGVTKYLWPSVQSTSTNLLDYNKGKNVSWFYKEFQVETSVGFGYDWTLDHGVYFALPEVDDVTKVVLSFHMHDYNSYNLSSVAVGVMTDPYDYKTFDTLALYSATSSKYQKFVHTFTDYTGKGKYIAIMAVDHPSGRTRKSTSGSSSAGYSYEQYYTSIQVLDGIILEEAGDCLPAGVAKIVPADTSAVVTWGSSNMTEWVVILNDADGVRLDSLKVDTNYYVAKHLAPHSRYSIYIASACDAEGGQWTEFTTECSPTEPLPYVENFEEYKGMDISNSGNRNRQMPYCWGYPTYSYTPSSGGTSVPTNYYPYITGSTSSAHKGSCAFYMASSSATNTNGDVWVSLPALADSINKLQIDFWTKGNGLTYDDQLYIGTMTDGEDYSTFVVFDSIRLTGNQWQEHIKPLSNYKGVSAGRQIALMLPKGSHYYYIDDIVIDYIVDCEKIFTIATSAPKVNGATFTWKETNADSCEVLVTKEAIDPESEIPATSVVDRFVTDTNVVIYTNGSLQLNTSYYVYVRAICATTVMPWSEQGSFKTTCEPQTAEEYGVMNFTDANALGCWTVGINSGTSNKPSRAGSATSKFGWYLNFYTAATSDGSYAIMPPLDVDDITKYQISFDICHNSTVKTNVERLTVGIITNAADLATFAPLAVVKDIPYATDSLGMIRVTIPFDKYDGDYVTGAKGNQVMFLTESGDSTAYAYVDNIQFEKIWACAAPSTVVADSVGTYGAKIAWNKTGEKYQVAITETKVDPSDAKAKVVWQKEVTDTFAIAKDTLQMLTTYYMYVRTICGVGDTSAWSNARFFTTICPDGYPLPFEEGFESYTTTSGNRKPDCWSCYYLNGTTITEGTNASYPSFGTTAANSHTGTRSIYMYSDNASTKKYSFAALPYIDGDLTKAMISFWYKSNATAAATPNRKVVVGIAEEVSTLDTLMATFQPIDTVISSATTFEKYTRIISEKYNGKGRYVVLIGIEGNGTTGTGGVYVDDIEISLVPTCFTPDNLSAKMYDASAELTWEQLQGDNKAWDLAYGLEGTDVKNMTLVAADTNVFVLNGLKPSTAYDFYVRANCGGGDVSDWRGPVTATTLYQIPLADAKWTFENEPTKPYITGQTNKAPESWFVYNYVTGVATTANVPYIQANSYNATTHLMSSHYSLSGDSAVRLYGKGAYIVLPIIKDAANDSLQIRLEARDTYGYTQSKVDGSDSLMSATYSYEKTSYARTLRVGTLTDPYDFSTFEELTAYVLPIVGGASVSSYAKASDDPEGRVWWREVVVPLYGAQGKYIVLAAPADKDNVVYIDDVVVEKVDPNACANVTKLAMDEDALKYNTAEFNWLSPKKNFKVTITEKDSVKPYATTVVDTAYFKIDSLQEQTTYTFSVQAVCGEDLSKAVTLDFTTPCKPTDQDGASWNFTENLYQWGTSATYMIPECWDEGLAFGSGASYTPYAIVNGTAAAATVCFARGDTVGDRALQFYTTKTYYNAYAVLPELSFPIDSMTLHFWGRAARFNSARCTTAGNKSKLNVKNDAYARVLIIGTMTDAADFETFTPIDTIRYDNVWTATANIYAYNDESGNGYWQEYALPLAKYAGKGRLAIVAPNPADFSTASTPTSYFYVDDLEIVKGDFCTPITGQNASDITSTSATIRWSSLVDKNLVELVVATGELCEDSTIIYRDTLSDVSAAAISGLKPATTYYYMLKHLCDTTTGDESEWTSIYEFTTDYVVRFSENFDGVKTNIPANWSRSISVAAADLFSGAKELTEASATASNAWRTNTGANQQVYANTTTNNASSSSTTASSQYNWLVTPAIDLTANAGDSLLISFDGGLRSQGGGAPNPNTDLFEQFIVVVSVDEGATWKEENATIWSNDGSSKYDFAEFYAGGKLVTKYVDVSAYAGKQIKIAFYIGSLAPAKIGGSKNLFYLDNIQLNKYTKLSAEASICRWEDYEGNGFSLDADQLPAGKNEFERFTPATKDGVKDVINTLTVNVTDETVNVLDPLTICEGEEYKQNGFEFIASESGEYKQKLQSGVGCDSIVVLNVTVNKKQYVNLEQTICQGNYYEFAGEKYYTNTTKTATFTAANGCDSIVSLYLTVTPILVGETEEVYLCPGTSYAFTEKYPELTEPGQYVDTIQNVQGCDSIVSVKINAVPNESTFFRAAICQGEVYDEGIFGGLRTAGDYSTPSGPEGLKTIYGCDSIVTLHLLVAQPTEEQTYELFDTISVENLPYVLNGEELLPVTTAEGVYPIKITLGCGEATLVVTVGEGQGISNTFVNTLALTPNPAKVGEAVRLFGEFSNASVEILSATGAVVYKAQNLTNPIVIPGMPVAGVYLVQLYSEGKLYQAKLMVQ